MNIDHYQLTLCALHADKMIQNIDRNSQGEQNRYLLKIFILPEKEKKINETINIILSSSQSRRTDFSIVCILLLELSTRQVTPL